MTTYVIECLRPHAHRCHGFQIVVGSMPLLEAIAHHQDSGLGVRVYRYGDAPDATEELCLAMAEVQG